MIWMNIILFYIGLLIFLIGFFVILLSEFVKKKEKIILWDKEKLNYNRPNFITSRGGHETVIKQPMYLFSLKNPSLVELEIIPDAGPFEVFLSEYFDIQAEPMSLSKTVQHIHKRLNAQENIEQNVNLTSGRYVLYFYTTALINTEFTLSETHNIKPFEKYLSLGETLLEVGIPIFITSLFT